MRFGRSKKKVIILTVALAAILSLYDAELMKALKDKVLTAESRKLSLNFGNGLCEWKAAIQYTDEGFPTDTPFRKTIIAGYPSGDKRLTFVSLRVSLDFRHVMSGTSNFWDRPISPSSRPTTRTMKVFGAGEMLVTRF